jgi:hypothetical protein
MLTPSLPGCADRQVVCPGPGPPSGLCWSPPGRRAAGTSVCWTNFVSVLANHSNIIIAYYIPVYYKKARQAITPSDDLTPYREIICQIKSTDFETLTKQFNKTNQKCAGNFANPPLCINIRTLT